MVTDVPQSFCRSIAALLPGRRSLFQASDGNQAACRRGSSPENAQSCCSQDRQAAWRPVTFTVGHVALISRASFHDPFRIRWEVPLGGEKCELGGVHASRECRQVDEPYVATCGAAPPAADTDLVRCHYRAP